MFKLKSTVKNMTHELIESLKGEPRKLKDYISSFIYYELYLWLVTLDDQNIQFLSQAPKINLDFCMNFSGY